MPPFSRPPPVCGLHGVEDVEEVSGAISDRTLTLSQLGNLDALTPIAVAAVVSRSTTCSGCAPPS